MRILGIDPGIATTGYGVIEKLGNKFKVEEYGVITTPAHTPLPRRLAQLATDLRQLIDRTSPQSCAVEELFFNTNAKTALIVGQARGVVLLVAEEKALNLASYTPIQVKLGVTGYGRAEKNQIQQMVKQLLMLDKLPKPDDAADALAIAICHAHSVRFTITQMIGFVHGIVDDYDDDSVTLDVDGIGYQIFVPNTVVGALPEIGHAVRIFTHHYIREDSQSLFGFLTREDLKLFSQLILVSGVGPKVGLKFFSSMNSTQLISAIMSENVAVLTTVPGVGKKLAERLIIELKDKLPKLSFASASSLGAASIEISKGMKPLHDDLLVALKQLGYSNDEIKTGLSRSSDQLTESMSLESALKIVFRHLVK